MLHLRELLLNHNQLRYLHSPAAASYRVLEFFHTSSGACSSFKSSGWIVTRFNPRSTKFGANQMEQASSFAICWTICRIRWSSHSANGLAWRSLLIRIITKTRYSHLYLNYSTSCLFSVMCYNVLSDKYCTRQMYGYSPSWCLRWEHRQRLIFEEMFTYDADVLCLQVQLFFLKLKLIFFFASRK